MATQSKSKWTKNAHSVFFARSWKEFLKFLIGQLWLQQKPDTLQAILVDKENLNTTDDEGRTALMWACESADTAAVRELNRSGANVRAKDKQGRTALMYAAARQSAEIVDVLLHLGGRIRSRRLRWSWRNGNSFLRRPCAFWVESFWIGCRLHRTSHRKFLPSPISLRAESRSHSPLARSRGRSKCRGLRRSHTFDVCCRSRNAGCPAPC